MSAEISKRRTADHSLCQRMYPVLGICERVFCHNDATERHHKDRDTGNNARNNIEFLCRCCHRRTHGQTANANWKPPGLQEPKPCLNCSLLSKPLRKGRCHSCAAYFGRTGTERPYQRVHAYSSLADRFNASIILDPERGCWLWAGAQTKQGRPIIKFNGKRLAGHRLSYELFVEKIPEGAMICHKCDMPLCVNPDHLYAGNAKSNMMDCVQRGRHTTQLHPAEIAERARLLGKRNTWTRNSRMPHAVIPHIDLAVIMAERERGVFLKDIAARYGVSGTAVYAAIVREKRRQAESHG